MVRWRSRHAVLHVRSPFLYPTRPLRVAEGDGEEEAADFDDENGVKKKAKSRVQVPISLFDQVLKGASDIVYDPHIGQYVEKTAIEAEVKVEDEQVSLGT